MSEYDFQDEDEKIRRRLWERTFRTGDDDIRADVDLVIQTNGDLFVDGCDYGEGVREFWGDWDYEYWLTVPSESMPRLLEELCAEAVEEKPPSNSDSDVLILDLLVQRFGTSDDPFSELGAWLEARGVPHTSDFWV